MQRHTQGFAGLGLPACPGVSHTITYTARASQIHAHTLRKYLIKLLAKGAGSHFHVSLTFSLPNEQPF